MRASTRVAGLCVTAALWGLGASGTVDLGAVDLSPVDLSADRAAPSDLASRGWVWPAAEFRLVRGYEAPAHEYGRGHRGIDLDPQDDAAIRAPAGGVVAFSGSVAGRGVLTIDHGDGLVTTLEPVSASRRPGEKVSRGEQIAALATGGHSSPGTVHFGVRLEGLYINPLLLLGGVPRAVLLPCC